MGRCMLIFETLLAMMLGAVLLSMLAQRAGLPYPTLLAAAGAGLALMPDLPSISLPPDLILALFVAPILLDAAHDMSLRDLRRNWRPVFSLVVVAVGLTTITVAATAKWFIPDMPWAAAVALGALLAPPDAVAALAVMRQVQPPRRIRTVIEGESLLNDASSLLIYRLAVASVAAGGFDVTDAVPAFVLVAFGSALAGWFLAKLIGSVLRSVEDVASATILQFVSTFGVWLLAERLHLSGVITVVTFGLTTARASSAAIPAIVRVSSFATWETVTFVLNVLAFLLVGLQLRSVLNSIEPGGLTSMIGPALAILAVVIVVRLVWVLTYRAFPQVSSSFATPAESLKAAIVVGWSGMRGIVTLAAALALPEGFPYRDFILLTAFVVVLGTLVVQGLTLKPLLTWLNMRRDGDGQDEIDLARSVAKRAAMDGLKRFQGPAVAALKHKYDAIYVSHGSDPDDTDGDMKSMRQAMVQAARGAIDALRDSGTIGDEAYRQIEEELDWFELSGGR